MFVDRSCLPAGKNESGQIKAVSKIMKTILKEYQSICICLVLALITIAVFWQVCTYDFVNYDDPLYVYENPNIQSGITPKAIKWAFTTGYASNWHPLTWLSHMLDWQLFGPKAGGHHLTNLIFHVANTLLLFIVLKQMTYKLWQSAFVAALFALHPLHVESVAWVAERKDVLSTFFWMLTMWAYVRFVSRPKIASYLLVVVFFALGLMSKPMLVTLPFVLLLLDYWPLDRFQLTKRNEEKTLQQLSDRIGDRRTSAFNLIAEKIPLFVISAVSSIVTYVVQQIAGALEGMEVLSLKLRIANALVSYVSYIDKMIYPIRLAVLYPHPCNSLPIWQVIVSLLIIAFISTIVIYTAKRRRYLAVGWLWYLGTMVPVIGLVQVGSQAMADRYTYLPSIGIFIMIAWGAAELFAKWRYRKIGLGLLAGLLLTAILLCTRIQVRYWQNSLTLAGHALKVMKNNCVIHNLYGCAMLEKEQLDQAIVHFKEALRIDPNYFNARTNLGSVFLKQGKLDEAIANLTEAMSLRKDKPEVYYYLGLAYTKQDKYDLAVQNYNKALLIKPDYPDVHFYLGAIYCSQRKIDLAITHWTKAVKLKPDFDNALNNLAWIWATAQNTKVHNSLDAVRFAKRACELTEYKRPDFLDTLAVAYAAAGDFSKAIETAEKALELCKSPEQNTLKKEIEGRLVLYKAGKPYIETQ
jgi:tetratricopeptide (TPR) repeat protein